jgi:hypothetical protein
MLHDIQRAIGIAAHRCREMQVQFSSRSTTLHGAPEGLSDAAISNTGIPMRPRFSSQCALEHRRFGFISAQFPLASDSLAFMRLMLPSLATEAIFEAALYRALLRHVYVSYQTFWKTMRPPWVSRQSGDRTSNVNSGQIALIRTVAHLSTSGLEAQSLPAPSGTSNRFCYDQLMRGRTRSYRLSESVVALEQS